MTFRINSRIEFSIFHIFSKPKVVTAIDEADLARRMERAEAENAEIDGDEDEEEEGMEYNGDDANDDENKAGSAAEDDDDDD